jgi:hypothetical protein
VRFGDDRKLDKGGHCLAPVYSEMIRQVCRDYSGIPDARTLSLSEIRFFFEGIRGELKQHTKPKG